MKDVLGGPQMAAERLLAFSTGQGYEVSRQREDDIEAVARAYRAGLESRIIEYGTSNDVTIHGYPDAQALRDSLTPDVLLAELARLKGDRAAFIAERDHYKAQAERYRAALELIVTQSTVATAEPSRHLVGIARAALQDTPEKP